MSKMSKATLEAKVEELEMFLKILTKENKELKNRVKELENIKVNSSGRKPFNNEKTIKKMFSLYMDGYSLQEISRELDKLNLKTSRGKSWSKSSISLIMKKESTKDLVGDKVYNNVMNQMKSRQGNKKK